MTEAVSLFDAHVHTQMAVCAEDITADEAAAKASRLGLAIGFSEHADQLYFPKAEYYDHERFISMEATLRKARDRGWSRLPAYRALVAPFRAAGIPAGLEVEAGEGEAALALLPEDRAGWDHLIGAVHDFRGFSGYQEPEAELSRDFMAQVRKLVEAGVNVLAHPFRIFLRRRREVPVDLYRPVVDLLAGAGVAAEINFHTNQPDPAFYALCLERGVRISVGSDSHTIASVGSLDRHVALLRELGVWDRLSQVMWHPRAMGG